MKRASLAGFVALILGLFASWSAVRAEISQAGARHSETGFGQFVAWPAVQRDDLETLCSRLPRERVQPGVVSESCKLVGAETLATLWYVDVVHAKFKQSWNWQGCRPGGYEPYSSEVEYAVILEGSRGSRDLRPIWWESEDNSQYSFAEVKVIRSPIGVVLQFEVCQMGSGGCFQQFFQRHLGRWRYLEQVYASQLEAALPEGLGLRRGIQVDIAHLGATAPLYRGGEATCCGTARVNFELALQGTRLVAKEFEFVDDKTREEIEIP